MKVRELAADTTKTTTIGPHMFEDFVRHYFTFGSNHTLPDGTSAADEYVIVVGPPFIDHRAIFTSWLGSDRFYAEYTEDEWEKGDFQTWYKEPHTALRVDEFRIVKNVTDPDD